MNNISFFKGYKPFQLLSLALFALLLAAGCKNGKNQDDFEVSYVIHVDEHIKFLLYSEKDFNILDPNKFDIDVEIDNRFLFQEPKVSIEGDTIDISLQPRGDWCECLMPNELNMKIISNTKEVAFEDEGSS